MKGYVRNCLIITGQNRSALGFGAANDNDECLFFDDGESIQPYLDGYAIIPVGEYERLVRAAGESNPYGLNLGYTLIKGGL